MAAVHLHLPFPSIIRPSSPKSSLRLSIPHLRSSPPLPTLRRRPRPVTAFSVGQDEIDLRVTGDDQLKNQQEEEEEEDVPASPQDLEYIEQIKRVLELLRKNRDMTFGEVKLTIMIEDPRDIERKILLGIEDPDEVTRDDLAAALEDVHEGIIPKNRVALRSLAEEINAWPNLEVEAPKTKTRKSLYAKATDTGIDPREAARRLNIDWDTAADIEEEIDSDEIEVPPALGYSVLYLVTGIPIFIGVSVVLILFYNSLQ